MFQVFDYWIDLLNGFHHELHVKLGRSLDHVDSRGEKLELRLVDFQMLPDLVLLKYDTM